MKRWKKDFDRHLKQVILKYLFKVGHVVIKHNITKDWTVQGEVGCQISQSMITWKETIKWENISAIS